jgi:hypothetical protein
MKYLLIALVLVGVYFQGPWSSADTNPEQAVASEAPVAEVDGHISAKDLERLGCQVDPSLGKYAESNSLILGLTKTFVLRSDSGCEVTVFNLIQRSDDYDPGVWAGVRAGTSAIARKKGFQVSSFEGNIGEYSEIQLFKDNDVRRGFNYTVQNQGVLYSLTVLSASIEPSLLLEEIILENMARVEL